MEIPEGLKAKVKTVMLIDWFNFEEYFKSKYGYPERLWLAEASNDTSHQVSIVAQEDLSEYDLNAMDEALEKCKSGDIEYYYLNDLFRAMYRDGYLPVGEYILWLSW